MPNLKQKYHTAHILCWETRTNLSREDTAIRKSEENRKEWVNVNSGGGCQFSWMFHRGARCSATSRDNSHNCPPPPPPPRSIDPALYHCCIQLYPLTCPRWKIGLPLRTIHCLESKGRFAIVLDKSGLWTRFFCHYCLWRLYGMVQLNHTLVLPFLGKTMLPQTKLKLHNISRERKYLRQLTVIWSTDIVCNLPPPSPSLCEEH